MRGKRKSSTPVIIIFLVLNLILGLLFTGAAAAAPANTFTITYHNNLQDFASVVDYAEAGQYQLQSLSGEPDSLLAPLYDRKPEDKYFKGWHTSSRYDDKLGVFYEPEAVIEVTEDLLLYAVWAPIVDEYYSVIYNLQSSQGVGSGRFEVKIAKTDGALMYEHTVLKWEEMREEGLLEEPDGYEFAGWYWVDQEGRTVSEVQPGYLLVSDRDETLYVKWRQITEAGSMVLYHLGGATGPAITGIPLGVGEEHTVITPADYGIVYSGYTFQGWRLPDNGQRYQPGETFTATEANRFYIFRAEWQEEAGGSKKEFRVTYDANGGSGGPATFEHDKGETHIVQSRSQVGISRSGYTFQGWNTAGNGSGTSYGVADQIEIQTNLVLYAQWKSDGGGGSSGGGNGGGGASYRVTYQPNNGTNEQSVIDSGYRWGATVTVKDGGTLFTAPEGKEFGGWSESADGSRYYSANERFTITRDETLYAIWVDAERAQLNYEDHFAYIVGYDDGTVRPEHNVTREEAATIFFRLLSDQSRIRFMTNLNDYYDVVVSDWSNVAISTLANAGIIKGEEGGAFRPQEPISRAELAAIATNFDESARGAERVFTDTADHWAKDVIAQAAAVGWVTGYEDGSFLPDHPITRAELITLVNNVQNRHMDGPADMQDGMTTFVDNSDTAKWYYAAIQEATNSHYYIRTSGVKETWTQLRANFDWAALERPREMP